MEIRIAADEPAKAACAHAAGERCSSRSRVSRRAEEIDGLDAECTHVLATSGDTPVGAARFRVAGDAVKIQRVGVSKEFRGKGRRRRDHRLHRRPCAASPACALCPARVQTHALEFYRKLGFEAYGDDYLDAGIPHRDMQLKL